MICVPHETHALEKWNNDFSLSLIICTRLLFESIFKYIALFFYFVCVCVLCLCCV